MRRDRSRTFFDPIFVALPLDRYRVLGSVPRFQLLPHSLPAEQRGRPCFEGNGLAKDGGVSVSVVHVSMVGPCADGRAVLELQAARDLRRSRAHVCVSMATGSDLKFAIRGVVPPPLGWAGGPGTEQRLQCLYMCVRVAACDRCHHDRFDPRMVSWDSEKRWCLQVSRLLWRKVDRSLTHPISIMWRARSSINRSLA